jgi:hypothetical protein
VLVIGRLDVATDGERYVAYELNGDQPGGLEYVSLLQDGPLSEGGPLPPTSPYRAYLDAATAYFYRHTGRERPEGVLLLANRYHLLAQLRQALARYFDCPVVVSQRGEGCRSDAKRLLADDAQGRPQPVDLVLRSPRVNIYELCDPELQAVRQAWELGRAVIVNPPHARVAGCKALLPVLARQDLLARAQVTGAEREAVTRLLPTVVRVGSWNRELLQRQQRRWVIKAPLGGKGDQVFLGPDTDDETWHAALGRACREPGWTASAFCPPFTHQVTLDATGRKVRTPASTDPYVVSGDALSVAGILSRAVLPQTDDPAELQSVKLNLLGENTYHGTDGAIRHRIVGLGRVLRRD